MTHIRKTEEPNMETALKWWNELPNKWTPVGWKDHMFRFNVLFNGTIIAQPDLNRQTVEWAGQGVQLAFVASTGGAEAFNPYRADFYYVYREQDDGGVIQGWRECETPVLWSEWAADGCIMRQYAFAHIPGGDEVIIGTEPLFAWVR